MTSLLYLLGIKLSLPVVVGSETAKLQRWSHIDTRVASREIRLPVSAIDALADHAWG